MASNSGWTTGLPSGQSTVDQIDDEFQSLKSFAEAWWEQEHYATSGSATSAGIAKHGAGRAFVGTASQLSNPTADNDGRLFHVTDEGSLRVGNVSTSSWSLIADNIQLTSSNSWTGFNDFSGGFETSDLSLNGIFTGVRSYTTSLNFVSTGAQSRSELTATDGEAANVTSSDMVLVNWDSTVGRNAIVTAHAGTNAIFFNFHNYTTGALNPSAGTVTAIILKSGMSF